MFTSKMNIFIDMLQMIADETSEWQLSDKLCYIYKLYTIFIELKFPFMSMLPNDYKS